MRTRASVELSISSMESPSMISEAQAKIFSDNASEPESLGKNVGTPDSKKARRGRSSTCNDVS